MNERERLASQADIYQDWKGIDRELTEAVGRKIASRLEGRRGLELGWGSGIMHGILATRLRLLDVVEGDPILAARARGEMVVSSRGAIGCTFQSLFEEFGPAGRYDEVIMSEVLEHVANPRKLLRKVATWLTTSNVLYDGRIHIAVPNGNSVHRLLGAMAGMGKPSDLGETDKRNGHRRVYTWDSIREEVEGAGLEVTHMEGVLLKPLPGEGMNQLTEAERRRLFELSSACPELCAEVYVECRRRESC